MRLKWPWVRRKRLEAAETETRRQRRICLAIEKENHKQTAYIGKLIEQRNALLGMFRVRPRFDMHDENAFYVVHLEMPPWQASAVVRRGAYSANPDAVVDSITSLMREQMQPWPEQVADMVARTLSKAEAEQGDEG